MAEGFVRTLLSLSLSGACLAALAEGMARLLRDRVPPGLRRLLWLLVLARLLCPWSLSGGLLDRGAAELWEPAAQSAALEAGAHSQTEPNTDKTQEITMSPLPSTTLNTITIEINDYLTLIDTPGLIDSGSILNLVDSKMVKKISPVKEIKPKTYQIRKNQSIIIEDFLRVDYVEGEKNSFTLYVSNDLKVKRLLNSNNRDDSI